VEASTKPKSLGGPYQVRLEREILPALKLSDSAPVAGQFGNSENTWSIGVKSLSVC
jgi:hypothetical protein